MSANSWGRFFCITSFGESHGGGLGVVIDGCPAGLEFDEALLRRELERRRPGKKKTESARNEGDEVEILSGVYEGKTLGTPIAMLVRNVDARSGDYQEIAAGAHRPGHADDMWKTKYAHVDPRGGGRSSGRETVARVMGGAVAQMLVKSLAPECEVLGFASQIGPFALKDSDRQGLDATKIEGAPARFPSTSQSQEVEALLLNAKSEGRSYGGIAEVQIHRPPIGLGQPVFHKLKADLAAAMMSVGATSGIDFGAGFDATHAEGSRFHRQGESPYGGIRGGLSTGEKIDFRVAFKPTSSVLDVAKKGRHDPCIVPRAVPVLEAMAWLVLADHLLWSRTDRL